ncbi:sensor histidine kinase [Micromonospora pattaloongensis]|uniref:sensor histidine kinase n=1 Tax=Micromonospora pattaloongensis TaxID=405436 RepID=UPI001587C8BC|nr:HAMP domain-containing sensor histidine kinase [Micromonospora pattaloongensis]
MLIGVGGLTVGLAVGGVALVAALGFALQRTADGEAFTTADAVARLAAAGSLPDPLPVAGNDVRVQVIDDRGRVLAASIGADRLVPILYDAERQRAAERGGTFIPGERLGLRGPVRVVAVPAANPAAGQTVLVAKSMADIRHSVQLLKLTLLVAFPLLVTVLAVVAWRVVGATLRPVEALRAGAEEITGGARPGALPVPASRDEIHRLAVTLNGMLDRLAAGRARQRAFVADAAHELRSPLANMRTELEVAQRLGPVTDWPALAEDLLVDVDRLGRLVDDLLLLARVDDATEASARRGYGPVELGELLAPMVARYPSPMVRFVPATVPLWTRGDPDGLTRVIGNLLDNAVRHARSRVIVTATTAGDRHVLTVTDDGPGIPAADRDRVFDRFTRLDDARARDGGGTGLGLAIVRELVRQHGGAVTLADAGPGLRAEVRLPAGSAQRAGLTAVG